MTQVRHGVCLPIGTFFPSSSLFCSAWNLSGLCGALLIVWDNDENFHMNQSGFSTSVFLTSVGHS
uniref:Uncharacterized protein n=1 Tax=Fagus sylvatica TaxID=28930 RepID=A0A2N9ENB9_FAGSY